MAWWVWLLIDLGIAAVAIAITAGVALSLFSRIKRLKSHLRELSAQAPRLDMPRR